MQARYFYTSRFSPHDAAAAAAGDELNVHVAVVAGQDADQPIDWLLATVMRAQMPTRTCADWARLICKPRPFGDGDEPAGAAAAAVVAAAAAVPMTIY